MTRRFLAGLFTLGLTTILLAAPDSALEEPITEKDRLHWAFRPLRRPSFPARKESDRPRTPIDAFILSGLRAKGLEPSETADRLTLLRRVVFDTTGLLPTVEERDRYLNDETPGAYERLIDRALSSPHFGERWAQHWLDTVRFAESNGYELDGDRPSAWRYRDYVVRCLNEDIPFDRFATEQIAGDELAKGKNPREVSQWWIATGLHRCGPQHVVSGNIDVAVNRQEILTEMVQGIGSAFLGITVHCARCHDHKFDPISQADYYRLEAFFAATKGKEIDFGTPDERTDHIKKVLYIQIEARPIRDQIAKLDAPYSERLKQEKQARLEPHYREALDTQPKRRSPDQQRLAQEANTLIKVSWDEILAAMSPEDLERRAQLRAKQHEVEAHLPMPPSQAWAVANEANTPQTYVLKRGDVKKKGAVVTMGFPRVVSTSNETPKSRLDLARWIASPENPLTARVFVNRVWMHYFGRGLVASPNDFGLHGERPTHPELLDYLASEFVASGWKVKSLHRMILLSDAYRQSSRTPLSEKTRAIDPDNRLLWRMNRKRMEGETLRDNMLLVSGELNRQFGGQSVRVPLEPEVYDLIFTEGEPDGLWPVTPDVAQHTRRSLYLLAKRNVRLPLMEAFDQPDRLTPCSFRARSTFAPQGLILMNGPFSLAQSKRFAARLLEESNGEREKLIRLAYRSSFLRSPSPEELRSGLDFLSFQEAEIRDRLLGRFPVNLPPSIPATVDPALAAATVDYALALFNLNEFLYVP